MGVFASLTRRSGERLIEDMEKEELGYYAELKERLEQELGDTPNLYPYADLLKLLELAADVATAETYERNNAIEELRSFLI